MAPGAISVESIGTTRAILQPANPDRCVQRVSNVDADFGACAHTNHWPGNLGRFSFFAECVHAKRASAWLRRDTTQPHARQESAEGCRRELFRLDARLSLAAARGKFFAERLGQSAARATRNGTPNTRVIVASVRRRRVDIESSKKLHSELTLAPSS